MKVDAAVLGLLASSWGYGVVSAYKEYPVKSGMKIWVDPATPKERQVYKSSRGKKWDLVMSDEFNEPGRDFRPGKDHIWTSLEKPDGVNGALELYSHNMTSTKCDDDGTCYFYIEIVDDPQTIRTYNMYLNPPAFENVEFHYRAAMVQSWNKFCFQGGMLEVRSQLPGAVSKNSGNPDLKGGPSAPVETIEYYPTWPGIWMLGNLGRAIFSASTNRMWPFSYDKCDPDVFEPSNQRISACNKNPGFGLNPGQGRGAPEIDLLEGGGKDVSSSLQIAPGMPMDFRLFPLDKTETGGGGCMYTGTCTTPGANHPGVPTAVYNKRGHKSWYQGLRYGANPFCKSDPSKIQDYKTVSSTMKAGITKNTCGVDNCPASKDGNAEVSLIDGVGPGYWGINSNGTCYPVINGYTGAYLCDPDNQHKLCVSPRPDDRPKSNIMEPFNYQMDAISSNWHLHVGAYLDYVVYQVEWVTGKNGYVRWMVDGHPLFEITTEAFSNVPQDKAKTNPEKIMLEEPMYLIMNVALSSSWGTTPPNPGKPCRGDGSDPKVNKICDEFPMFLKVDYIRFYQDLDKNRDADNLMQLSCDPPSHPTREWILGHIDEYQDWDNPLMDVAGGAYCTSDDDCTIGTSENNPALRLVTGKCEKKRCKCTHGGSWGGPRCTIAMRETQYGATETSVTGFGPPMEVAISMAALVVVLTTLSVWYSNKSEAAEARAQARAAAMAKPVQAPSPNDGIGPAKVDYTRNFV
ncbi:hypothetical protein Poli38472_009313 [Pythium oligandrum]|uniref:Uncharacterized protein n=1 Tax=Pythium oligandrum TaxID=41045 RepID=A0A8K1FJP3_PYTOL|nr:hypothetical protein Poli38472_009313 [Pythium oligandrum]|eukprot:TMW65146.1 hypothetical protein Poli38472_009313 [Pythium oligandrum]